MKNEKIQVQLSYYGSSGTYRILKLHGAVSVWTECKGRTEHHVGATLIEKEAVELVHNYDVTVIPAK